MAAQTRCTFTSPLSLACALILGAAELAGQSDPRVDPQVTIGSPGGAQPAMAHDPIRGQVLLVDVSSDADGGQRITGRFLQQDNLQPVGGMPVVAVSQAPGSQNTTPAVAFNPATGHFLVAWAQRSSLAADWDVRVRGIAPDGATTGAFSIGGVGDQDAPDVGGCSDGVCGDFGVVCRDDNQGIRWITARVDAQGLLQPTDVGGLGSLPGDAAPAIARSTAGAAHTVICYRTITGAVQGRVWDFSAQSFAPLGAFALPVGAAGPAVELSLDGGDGRWLLAATRATPGGHGDVALTTTGISFDPGGGVTLVARDVRLRGAPGENWTGPAVAWAGERFLVTGREAAAGETPCLAVDRVGCVDCARPMGIPLGGLAPEAGASVVAWRPLVGPGRAIWARVDGAGGIAAFPLAAMAPEVPPTMVAPGCGTAGDLVTTGGAARLGNGSFALEITGAPQDAITAWMLVGVPGPRLSCGTCQVLAPGSLLVLQRVAMLGGRGELPLPVPCLTWLAGQQLDAQAVVWTGAAAPCVRVPGVSATGVHRLTVVD